MIPVSPQPDTTIASVLPGEVSLEAQRRLFFQRPKWSLSSFVYFFAFLTLMPVAWLVLSWLELREDLWLHLYQTQLFDLIWNTIRLAFGVFIGVAFLGTFLAWIVTKYEFPGRAIFEWALVLPFAIPAYVFAFIFVGTFDGASPAMVYIRELTGLDFWPNVRHFWGVLASFVFAFYPYVYLLARNAFKRQGQEIYEVAQSLGCSPVTLFFRVAMPIAWPSVVAGAGLAVMEALADFGTVSVFNFQTFTTAIYKAWFGFFSLQTAAQLASLLVLAVLAWRSLEGFMLRGRDAANEKTAHSRALQRVELPFAVRWSLTGFVALILLITFIVPMIRLVTWAWEAWNPTVFAHFTQHLSHSLLLSLIGSFLVLLSALFLSVAARLDRRHQVGFGIRCATLGYALPGSILAVGLMLVFAALDTQLQGFGIDIRLVGGLVVLLTAYIVRFLAVGYSGASNALSALQPHVGEAGKMLGASQYRRLFQLYCPLLAPGFAAAFLLVAVDILKEMPATLLLRPFGWDTLAVSIYGFTAEGDWALAAIPAIALVIIGLAPVYILVKRF